jgi:hypothetical protein
MEALIGNPQILWKLKHDVTSPDKGVIAKAGDKVTIKDVEANGIMVQGTNYGAMFFVEDGELESIPQVVLLKDKPLEEKVEILKEMELPLTTIIDYLIERLKRNINMVGTQRANSQVVATWMRVQRSLEDARAAMRR